MAPNQEPAVMPPQNVSSRYGVAGYRGSHVIAGTVPAATAASPAAVVVAAPVPAKSAGLAARGELVKRAMVLGLKGSGSTAELTERIAAKEAELAAAEAAGSDRAGD